GVRGRLLRADGRRGHQKCEDDGSLHVSLPLHVRAGAKGKIVASRIDWPRMWNRFAVLLLLTSLSARADAQRASDLEVGGAFMLSAVVLAPLDRRMHDFLTQPSLESNVALHRSANTISALILPGTAGIVLGTYIAGQVGHDRGLAEIGFHGGEAI